MPPMPLPPLWLECWARLAANMAFLPMSCTLLAIVLYLILQWLLNRRGGRP